MKSIFCILICLMLVGCAVPINKKTYIIFGCGVFQFEHNPKKELLITSENTIGLTTKLGKTNSISFGYKNEIETSVNKDTNLILEIYK